MPGGIVGAVQEFPPRCRDDAVTKHSRVWVRARREAGLSALLAIQVAIMFVLAPFSATGGLQPVAIELARFALGAVAVLTVTRSRPIIALIASTFLASTVLSVMFRTGGAGVAISLIRLFLITAFDVVVAVAVARVAFGPGRVTVHRIMGGVILYLSVGLIFAEVYRAAALTLHPSFSGLPTSGRSTLSELLYFSLSTLTTTGFGDITPLHPFIRSMANLEAVIGQLFPATLLARLVTLHSTKAEP